MIPVPSTPHGSEHSYTPSLAKSQGLDEGVVSSENVDNEHGHDSTAGVDPTGDEEDELCTDTAHHATYCEAMGEHPCLLNDDDTLWETDMDPTMDVRTFEFSVPMQQATRPLDTHSQKPRFW